MDIDKLRQREADIREKDADAHRELREVKEKAETARADDVAALAAAMAAGDAEPKGTVPKLRERQKDLEVRRIPALDEALWSIAMDARATLAPDLDERRLNIAIKRWARSKVIQDPSNVLPSPHGDPRPKDVVAWVEARIDQLRLQDEDQRRREADRATFLDAKRRLDKAQQEHNGRERQRINEAWEEASPQAKADGNRWQPQEFNRYKFLKSEGLLAAYGWVQPGMAIQTQGGRERPVELVPRADLEPASTEA